MHCLMSCLLRSYEVSRFPRPRRQQDACWRRGLVTSLLRFGWLLLEVAGLDDDQLLRDELLAQGGIHHVRRQGRDLALLLRIEGERPPQEQGVAQEQGELAIGCPPRFELL